MGILIKVFALKSRFFTASKHLLNYRNTIRMSQAQNVLSTALPACQELDQMIR